jgi:adenylate cyclase class 2
MKEIEIKILGIDPLDIERKLSILGAEFKGETLQKIHTYDLFPISATFLGIINVLKKNIAKKENELSKQKLIALLSDLSDLLKEEDKIKLAALTGEIDFNLFINFISQQDTLPAILFTDEFYQIVNDYDTNPNKWIRLRESNGKTTITLKQIFNRKVVDGVRYHSISSVKEIEVQIDDVEKGDMLLHELGYYHKNYQEKKRISYLLPNKIEIDIDFWPHIPPYMEIEAPTEELVYKTVKKLGFSSNDAVSLNADDVYTHYGLNMYDYKELKFES